MAASSGFAADAGAGELGGDIHAIDPGDVAALLPTGFALDGDDTQPAAVVIAGQKRRALGRLGGAKRWPGGRLRRCAACRVARTPCCRKAL